MRDNYMSYTDKDKVQLIEPQCKTCKENLTPTKCKKYDIKPTKILLNKSTCKYLNK